MKSTLSTEMIETVFKCLPFSLFFFFSWLSSCFLWEVLNETGWGTAWSGGKARGSLCISGGNGPDRDRLHRWRSGAGSVHGGLLWDADQVRARAFETLQGSHAFPPKNRVPIQSSHNFFLRFWWLPFISLLYYIFYIYTATSHAWVFFDEHMGLISTNC